MDLNISGKTALVSASSKGIGLHIAKKLSLSGVDVSIFSTNKQNLDSAKEFIKEGSNAKLISNVCDLRNKDEINDVFEKTISEFGSIDILVNNTGGPPPGTLKDITNEQIDISIKTNLLANMTLTKLCLEEMQNKKWGRIINILSISAKEPLPNMLLSNTIRPAVVGFSKTISKEYADLGITINNILPSSVLTERTDFFVREASEKKGTSYEEELKLVAEGLPIKYLASPEQIADLALFLASDRASYITGSSISIDGGLGRSLF